ncbi:unnamed protein product [Alternaria alternata]
MSAELISLYQKHSYASGPTWPVRAEDYENTLEVQIGHFDAVFLIADALDECRDDDAIELQLDTRSRLLQTFGVLGDKVHLLITSRDEHLRATGLGLGLEERFRPMKVSVTDDDIFAYVDGRIAAKEPLRILTSDNPMLKEDIKKTVAAKAASMFLPVQLYMDFLGYAAEPVMARKGRVRKALRSLPSFRDKSFEEAYQRAYQSILKGIFQDQNPSDVDLARRVLSWVVFTKDRMHLTVGMVQRALSISAVSEEFNGNDDDDHDDEYDDEYDDGYDENEDYDDCDEVPVDKILSVCRGLLTVDHRSQILRFVHFTAEEYFSSPRIQDNDFPRGQEQIAKACLSCILSDPCEGSDQMSLYQYSSRHWGHHAKIVEDLLQSEIDNYLNIKDKMQKSFGEVIQALPVDWDERTDWECQASSIEALHVASYFGLKSTAAKLLQSGHNTETTDSRGRTAMRWAIMGASDALVTLLFNHKASLLSQDLERQPTIFWAFGRRLTTMLHSRIRIEGDSKVLLGDIYLGDVSAVKSGQSFATALPSPVMPRTSNSVLEFLLQNLSLADLDFKRPRDGRTLLSVVTENWQWDAVKTLLERGADINSKDNAGITPLVWSLYCPRRTTIIDEIQIGDASWLSVGDITNVHSSVVIDISDASISEDIIEPNICLLIGEDLEAQDGMNRTALSLAAENRFHMVAEAILKKGGNPNTATPEALAELDGLLSHANTANQNDYLQQKAYTSLLVAMLDRRGQFLIEQVMTSDSSSIFINSTSRIAKLFTWGSSQVLIMDKPSITELVASDFSVIDIRAAANIVSLKAYDDTQLVIGTAAVQEINLFDNSLVQVKGPSTVKSIRGYDDSTLVVAAKASVDRIVISEHCRMYSKGQTEIRFIQGIDSGRIAIGAEVKIAEMDFSGNSKLYTRHQSRISVIRGGGKARVTIGGETTIDEVRIGDECLVHTKGPAKISRICSFGKSSVVLRAEAKIDDIQTYDNSSVWTGGSSEILALKGYDRSSVILQAEVNIEEVWAYDNCLIFSEDKSEIRTIYGTDRSSITILEGDDRRPVHIDASGSAKVMFLVQELAGASSDELQLHADASRLEREESTINVSDNARMMKGTFPADKSKDEIVGMLKCSVSTVSMFRLHERQLDRVAEDMEGLDDSEEGDMDEIIDVEVGHIEEEDWSWAVEMVKTQNDPVSLTSA